MWSLGIWRAPIPTTTVNCDWNDSAKSEYISDRVTSGAIPGDDRACRDRCGLMVGVRVSIQSPRSAWAGDDGR